MKNIDKNLHCFKETLQKVSDQGLTGTIFIVSESNRSGQVVFDRGYLVGLNYCGLGSHEAFTTLIQSSNLRCAFTTELCFPVHETLSKQVAMDLLKLAGVEKRIKDEIVIKPEQEHAADHLSSVIYRGQRVKRDIVPKKTEPKKSGLIYRGQVMS